jgi:hypothetical protein
LLGLKYSKYSLVVFESITLQAVIAKPDAVKFSATLE